MDELDRFLAEANQFASLSTFDERVQFLERGITRFPTEPRLFTDLGQVYMYAGDWETALKHSNRAVQLKPHHIDALYNIGRCNLYRGELQMAKEAFQQALRHAPNDLEIIDNLAMIEADIALRSNPNASLHTALAIQHKWADLQPQFRFDEDDLLFRLAVNFKSHNKFSAGRTCLERMGDEVYPDRSKNIAMLAHLLELAAEIDHLIRNPGGVMRLFEFLGDASPIFGSLDRIRNFDDEVWTRLTYHVIELAFDHFVLFEQLNAYLREGRLPSVLPQHEGVHWAPMVHLTTGILHDLLTHFGSPTRLMNQLRAQPVWGKVQNLRVLRLLEVLIAASGHKLTSASIHGALGIGSKTAENVAGRYLAELLQLLTAYWHHWGSAPAFEGRDFG